MPLLWRAAGQAVPDPRDPRVACLRASARPFRAPNPLVRSPISRRVRVGATGDRAADMSTSFSRDVVIVGGCGHVGLPLGLVLADAGLSVTLFDVESRRGRPRARGEDAVLGARRRRVARAADRDRPARRDDRSRSRSPRPSTSCSSSARRSTSTSTPIRSSCCMAVEGILDQLRDGQHLVLRSTVYPRRHRDGREADRGVGAHDRRVVLPGAHRGGQGDRRAALAAADRLGAHRARGARAPKRCSARSRRRSSTSTSRKPSSRSSSRTRGATSSSRPRTSCS